MATVRLSGTFRTEVGRAEVKIAGATLGEVLQALIAKHPSIGPVVFDERGALRRHVSAFVNGEDARFGAGLATPLQERDVVTLLQAMAGG